MKIVRKGKKIDGNNANRFWELWGIRLFGGGLNEVLKIIDSWIDTVPGKKRWIATVNPEFVMKTQKDREFFKILQKTDLNIIDGVGLVWARNVGAYGNTPLQKIWRALVVGVEVMRGKYKNQVVAGAGLMKKLCVIAARKKWRVFFLGGWGDRAERTAKYFSARGGFPPLLRGQQFSVFPDVRRDFTRNGVIRNFQCDWCPGEPEVSNEEVIRKINDFKPHLLFVAYGMRKQEEWIEKNLSKIDVRLAMGVGRSFDYYSGDLPRAPVWVRRMGMEWLYSLIKEPKRWRRQVELIRFVKEVIK